MSDKGCLKDEMYRQESNLIGSPFPFLKDASSATIDFVHAAILSETTAEEKNYFISKYLKGVNLQEKYNQWQIRVMKGVPDDQWPQLYNSAQEGNSRFSEVIIDDAKNRLQHWKQGSHRHLEQSTTVQQSTIDRKRQRMENENIYLNDIENVSALHSHSSHVSELNDRAHSRFPELPVNNNNNNIRKVYPGLASEKEAASQDELFRSYNMEKKSSNEKLKGRYGLDTPVATAQRPYPNNITAHFHHSSANSFQPNPTVPIATSPATHVPSPTKIETTAEVSLSAQLEDLGIDLATTKPLFILLLGETGVGKTTVINSLANYLKYKTMDEVLAGEPTILVDTSFTTTNRNHKSVTIEAKANTGKNKDKENEVLGSTGCSSTQDPMNHVVRWNENGVERVVVLIDTPGINDTRGAKQDEKNFEKILSHISKIGQLHAICILMKPNESKFTVGFRYCLDNLLVKLHKSATQNILFCFTNTRSTLYRPGDTLTTLHEYLKILAKDTGVRITADRTNIFCFDNDCFRYMCILQKFPLARTPSSMATFSAGWTHNVEEAAKMLTRVEGLSAHIVEDTVNINKTRRLVTALARPLAEIARNHALNMKLIEETIQEIESLKRQGKEIGSRIHNEQVVMEVKQLPFPRTVCTSKQCNQYERLNRFETQRIPLKICHDKCYLRNVQEQSVNNPNMASCEAFKKNFEMCKVCGCHWRKHMHISYELVPSVADRNAHERFVNHNEKKQNAEIFLKEQKEKLKMLENEHDQIRECCAEFAAFLSTNSIKQTTDPFLDYLRHLIEDEENKSAHGESNVMLCESVLIFDSYEHRVKEILKDIQSDRRSALTSSQLNNHIHTLCRLKHCGPTIAQLKDLEFFERAETPDHHIEASVSQNYNDLTNDLKNVRLNSHEYFRTQ